MLVKVQQVKTNVKHVYSSTLLALQQKFKYLQICLYTEVGSLWLFIYSARTVED